MRNSRNLPTQGSSDAPDNACGNCQVFARLLAVNVLATLTIQTLLPMEYLEKSMTQS